MLSSASITRFTASDGYAFAVRLWPCPQPMARMVFVHGIISHSGWYPGSCRFLAERGFEVHFLDRRGSGLNLQDRGDVRAYDVWLSDVEEYLEHLPSDVPRMLLGISWGGTLTAAVARHRPELLAGIGLLCPGLFSHQAANAAQRAAIRLAYRAGLRNLRVNIPLQDPALFTESAIHRQYIGADPLTLRQITLRFAWANLHLTQYATEAPHQIRVPTLLMLAGRDPITDNPRTRAFVERIASDDKTIVEYPAASHTLEYEPAPEAYYADLAAWGRRLAAG